MTPEVLGIRAPNPGPYTLSGTNSWIVGRDPAWVIDPGPDLDEHLDALVAAVAARGGAGGIAITHDHPDHVEGVAALRERLGGPPLAAARLPAAGVRLVDGERYGPLLAVATPGHSPDHFAFIAGRICFSGDTVLGEGSVFVGPEPGAMASYLASLRRLRELPLDRICPGHGPEVSDPIARLDEQIAHRLEREARLVAALAAGARTEDELLAAAWDDVPEALRPAAAYTLAAHLDKLRAEGRL